jgi:hypothetical protein
MTDAAEVEPVIAKPDSSTTPEGPASTSSMLDEGPLSAAELYQLTLYKWRYSLEAYGFDEYEVRELMFLKWLHASRRVEP